MTIRWDPADGTLRHVGVQFSDVAAVRVDARDANAAVELVRGVALPLLYVHRGGDGGAVVGHERLQGAVHEEVVLLENA